MRRRFRNHLNQLLEKKSEEVSQVSFQGVMPKQIFEKLPKNVNTKFRFRIVVEAEEIEKDELERV
jgi:hypothetical protein